MITINALRIQSVGGLDMIRLHLCFPLVVFLYACSTVSADETLNKVEGVKINILEITRDSILTGNIANFSGHDICIDSDIFESVSSNNIYFYAKNKKGNLVRYGEGFSDFKTIDYGKIENQNFKTFKYDLKKFFYIKNNWKKSDFLKVKVKVFYKKCDEISIRDTSSVFVNFKF